MLLYHLSELKLRLFYISLTYIFTFIINYLYYEELLIYISKSLISLNIINHFIYTSITEAFVSYLSLILFISFIVCIPTALFNVWLYLIPGLYLYERRSLSINLILLISILLLATERSIHLLIPNIFNFFVNFSQDLIILDPKINEYISSVMNLILTLMLILSIPLLAYLMHIDHNILVYLRKYVVLLILIVISSITPPNIIILLLISIPLIVIYELLIYIKIYKSIK